MDDVTSQAAAEVKKARRTRRKRHDPVDQTDERVRAAHGRSVRGGVNGGRVDPDARHTSGQLIGRAGGPIHLCLAGRDPNRTYCLPYKGGTDTEMVSYMESLGYRIEEHRGDKGVRLGGRVNTTRNKPGTDIEWRGHVLMSVDNEIAEEIRKFGPDGQSGSTLTEMLASRIRGKTMHREAFRQRRDIASMAYENRQETEELNADG